MSDYEEFLKAKTHEGADHGFDPVVMPDALFDFQSSLVEWAVRKGRAAIFADCGLGKTPMQLAWAQNVARKTEKPVLVLTPLAVAAQMRELHRVTMPGRCSAVHVTDIPASNTGCDHLFDLAGETIKLHESEGFDFVARHTIWKEPLAFRNRTMTHNLSHQTIVEDGAMGGVASADYLLMFRKRGSNPVPVAHPHGLSSYAGESQVPHELRRYRDWKGKQTENRWSHWIWRQYASSVWDDVRLSRVLPFRDSKSEDDEKHVHPLQLDVIERAIVLRSNPGEVVLTPFMGVGSEVYGAVTLGRLGIGAELKESYYRQAVQNMEAAERGLAVAADTPQAEMFAP